MFFKEKSNLTYMGLRSDGNWKGIYTQKIKKKRKEKKSLIGLKYKLTFGSDFNYLPLLQKPKI